MHTPLLKTLIERFDRPDIDALVLMGSYARGEAHQYSDIDLARFTRTHGEGRAEAFGGLIDGQLVNVNDLGPQAVEEIFTKPEVATTYLAGLCYAIPLRDRNRTFAQIQARAHAFVWDAAMQQAANAWASESLASWSEDMRKGLAGLITHDIGQLLSSRFGSSWGLQRVMQVQRGILMQSGHDFYDAIGQSVGQDSEWVRLRRITFAIPDHHGRIATLHEQVVAGLQLYSETARLLEDILRTEDQVLIHQTVALIREALMTQQVLQRIRI